MRCFTNRIAFLVLIVGLIFPLSTAAQAIPTPDWPDLPSPTAWASPTPLGASTAEPNPITDQSSSLDSIATAQAQAAAMPTQIAAANDQLYWQGQPLLPNENGAQFWGYTKYIFSQDAYRVFGSFGLIVTHLGIIITGALAILSIFFSVLLIVTIFKLIRFIFELITGMFI